jgi:hypothetical protein
MKLSFTGACARELLALPRKYMRKLPAVIAILLFIVTLSVIAMRRINLNFEIAKLLIGDPLPIDEMYPPSPKDLPVSLATPLPELLIEYEGVLKALGVDLETSFQKGLTDSELNALEEKYACELSSDIRELYKWHNGTPIANTIEVFPSGRFLPIDYSLESKASPPPDKRDPEVIRWSEEMLAFRKSWIEIIADGSGNGFYYDPDRITHSSSFFHNYHDDVPFDFYPCVGNYIQSLIDHNEAGNLKTSEFGIQFTYEEETSYVNRYGKRVR